MFFACPRAGKKPERAGEQEGSVSARDKRGKNGQTPGIGWTREWKSGLPEIFGRPEKCGRRIPVQKITGRLDEYDGSGNAVGLLNLQVLRDGLPSAAGQIGEQFAVVLKKTRSILGMESAT